MEPYLVSYKNGNNSKDCKILLWSNIKIFIFIYFHFLHLFLFWIIAEKCMQVDLRDQYQLAYLFWVN